MNRVGQLVGIVLLAAVLTVGPIGTVFGSDHWLCGAVGFGLSLPPAMLTLWLTLRFASRSPYGALMGLALGPVVRLPVVLFAGGAIFAAARLTDELPGLTHPLKFWLWVLFAYLVALIAETVLLARPVEVSPSRADVVGGRVE